MRKEGNIHDNVTEWLEVEMKYLLRILSEIEKSLSFIFSYFRQNWPRKKNCICGNAKELFWFIGWPKSCMLVRLDFSQVFWGRLPRKRIKPQVFYELPISWHLWIEYNWRFQQFPSSEKEEARGFKKCYRSCHFVSVTTNHFEILEKGVFFLNQGFEKIQATKQMWTRKFIAY